MSKPETLKDLLKEGHISLGEVNKIAASIFDGSTTAAGPEGYIITACTFDDLPDHVRGFVRKAILEFRVHNVLDRDEDEEKEDLVARATDGEYRTVDSFED